MDESIGIIGGIFYLAVIILIVASIWKVFEKAGKPGWAAIVPIYNYIVMLEIVGKPTWWIVLLLIPFVNIFIALYMVILLAQSFNKSTGFAVGMILLPIVFYPMLAFGDATYHGPAGLQKSDF
jgi:hypothetical protein